MSIFVSIASYRDPQLVPTIQDCLAKARRPQDLRFGICWQRGPEETGLEELVDARFRILDVDWRQSRGACWARAEIMRRWEGEDFFLQLDSHHRFVQDWDEILLRQIELAESSKPILTAYVPHYNPEEPTLPESDPLQLSFFRWTEEGIPLQRPSGFPSGYDPNRPRRARFLSAHFLFAPGSFVQDVPYDPDLYFIGEEISIAIRAFTHGYDLFHPSVNMLWHEYTRNYRTKHWDDHVDGQDVERAWYARDKSSRDKVAQFLVDPFVGPFGCGTERSVSAYEAYAGVSFRWRRVQEYTRDNGEPPNPPMSSDWAERIRTHRMTITLDRANLVPAALDQPKFWYVGFHDADGQEIYREDATASELGEVLARPSSRIALNRQFESGFEPVSWTVWPASQSGEWLEKVVEPVGVKDGPVTLVTALVDIGRGQLLGPFARPFDKDYLPLFERLLAVDLPMVVYVEEQQESFVWRIRRRENTRVVRIGKEDLRRFPYFEQVQAIRSRAAWRAQAGWLPFSPQAALELYNPLVMSKLLWLADQARENHFKSERLFWVDAGLCRTVPEDLLRDPSLGRRLVEAADKFLIVGFPYTGGDEVHGFSRAALTEAAEVDVVARVIRGGFFGGPAEAVGEVAALYDRALGETLDAGHMGTEESVLTLLSYRHPERFRCFMVDGNGMMGPFFEDLCEGQARRLLLREPRSIRSGRWPAGLLSEDRDVARVGHTSFFGLPMMQNRNAVGAWHELLQHVENHHERPARIITIGAGFGGLTALLQTYCLVHDTRLIAYEPDAAGTVNGEMFNRLRIDRRTRVTGDACTTGEIASEIQKDGVSLVACDGANKVEEVRAFADYLKPGDLILAHDYAPDQNIFERALRGRLWDWCEILRSDISEAIARNDLRPILPDTLLSAAWGGWVKRGETMKELRPRGPHIQKIDLHVLSYNAPEQFQALVESILKAAPDILAGADKTLLNNSTEPSTFDAYDRLCDQYGFTQHRLGNLGINGGRMWCANHFDATSRCEAMLYFEDDMLLQETEGVCKNGFRTRVPDLLERAKEIVECEDLDFLKLCFTEVYGDHTQNWAYHNLSDGDRVIYFPEGPSTRVDAIRSHGGLSYIVGDIFYSNWPTLMTHRGNRTLFVDAPDQPAYEQFFMVRALKLMRSGSLRGGVLLASPVNHHRVFHYPREERRES